MKLRSFQRGLSALIIAGAPQEDIDAYFEEEGIVQDPRAARSIQIEQNIGNIAKICAESVGQLSQQVNTVAAALAGEMAKLSSKIEALGGIEAKVNTLAKIVATKDDTAMVSELERIKRTLIDLQNKPQPVMPKVDLSKVDALENKIKMLENTNKDQFDKLLNAKRVPEFDAYGNIKSVRLEA